LGANQSAQSVYLEKKKTLQAQNAAQNAAPQQPGYLGLIKSSVVAAAKNFSSTLSSCAHQLFATYGPLRLEFAFMSYLVLWCRGRITFDQLKQRFHTSTDIFDFFILTLKRLLGQAPYQQKSKGFDSLWARVVLSYIVKPLAQRYTKRRKHNHNSAYGFEEMSL
jgi:hypothetical protein